MKSLSSPAPPFSWETERRRFIDAGGNSTHSFGLGRLIGRVYALLYLIPESMSLEQVAEALQVSKASASITLRQLESWQAVQALKVDGDCRDFYIAQTDFSVLLRKGIMPGVRKKLHSAGVQIERTLDITAVPAETRDPEAKLTREQTTELRRRLKSAQALHKRVDRILGSRLLARFL